MANAAGGNCHPAAASTDALAVLPASSTPTLLLTTVPLALPMAAIPIRLRTCSGSVPMPWERSTATRTVSPGSLELGFC